MKSVRYTRFALLSTALFGMACAAFASTLTYSPSNSPISNPVGWATAMKEQASLTRPERDSSAFAGLSEADLLKQSIIAGISSNILGSIRDNTISGSATFGDTTVTYTTVGGVRIVTITNNITGVTTTIRYSV